MMPIACVCYNLNTISLHLHYYGMYIYESVNHCIAIMFGCFNWCVVACVLLGCWVVSKHLL